MDSALQRYLDGMTLLLSVIVGELLVLTYPTRPNAPQLVAVGFGVILYMAIASYQRRLFGSDGSDSDIEGAGH